MVDEVEGGLQTFLKDERLEVVVKLSFIHFYHFILTGVTGGGDQLT